jgi:hypothetical protein
LQLLLFGFQGTLRRLLSRFHPGCEFIRPVSRILLVATRILDLLITARPKDDETIYDHHYEHDQACVSVGSNVRPSGA